MTLPIATRILIANVRHIGLSIDIEIRKDPQLSGFIIFLRKKVAAGMRDPK